jgi:CysZ protein
MVLGLIPGVITALLLLGVFVAIALWVDDWAAAISAGATGDPTPNTIIVTVVALAIIGGSALLAIYTFTAVTLLIGQPFFEAIADRVAPRAGLTFTAEEEAWWRATLRGVREGLALLLFGGAIGVSAFVIGLVPVVGTITAFCVSAIVGGWLLSLELSSYPLQRAGVATLKGRRHLVRARRPLAMGFGVTAYLLCLVPLGAVIAMPALVAGGTLLAARLGAPHE